MANNDQVLEQLNKRFDAIEKNIATKADIQRLEQGQHSLHEGQGKLETMLEAVVTGQQELQETAATRADIQDLKATLTKKVNDNTERIEELEKIEGIPHPHKH